MRRGKRYSRCWDREARKVVLMHRKIAEEMLARPLLPSEIVHHRDGDSLNNAPENLLVLPSQRYHAHIEYHLRCEKRGQPLLFPELLHPVREERRGTLFEAVLPCLVPQLHSQAREAGTVPTVHKQPKNLLD